jgi:uncharacterized membrane protein HdeD (DUF308 family)
MLKTIFAIISLALSLGLFIPYYNGIRKKETKPHLLSWTTWFILTSLGFYISFTSGGGIGSFTFGFQALLYLTVIIYALLKKEKNIVSFDWLVFSCVLIILTFYFFTKDALLSVIFAASIDCLGYLPTFRKSYLQPSQEPPMTYFLGTLSWLFSIFALANYSTVTLIYPIALVIINGAFVSFLLIRRKIIKTTKNVN